MGTLISALLSWMLADYSGADPVEWSYSAVKTGDKTYEVRIRAEIGAPWHIYSQSSPEGGALPTQFTFNKNPVISLEGKIREEGKMHEQYEEVFGVEVKYYNDKVEFVQKVKMKVNAKTILTGTVEFMLCNNTQCLPPKTISFSVPIPASP